LLALDDTGCIRDCNAAAEVLFGYPRDRLLSRHISLLMPGLAALELTRDGHLNGPLNFISWVDGFEAMHRDGVRFGAKVFITGLVGGGAPRLRLRVRTVA
jgi:PAS domain-containing protein